MPRAPMPVPNGQPLALFQRLHLFLCVHILTMAIDRRSTDIQSEGVLDVSSKIP